MLPPVRASGTGGHSKQPPMRVSGTGGYSMLPSRRVADPEDTVDTAFVI